MYCMSVYAWFKLPTNYYNPRMKQFVLFILFYIKLSLVLRYEAAVLPEGCSTSSSASPCTAQEHTDQEFMACVQKLHLNRDKWQQ